MNSARYAVGLDVGSSRTRCVICLLDDGMMRYLGHAEHAIRRVGKGATVRSDSPPPRAFARPSPKRSARRRSPSRAAVVGVGGGMVEGANSRGLYEFGRPREIDAGDLNYAVELASKLRLHDDRLCCRWRRRISPSMAAPDIGIRAASPARGSKPTFTFSPPRLQDHQTLVHAVHQAHLGVEETIFEPMAAALRRCSAGGAHPRRRHCRHRRPLYGRCDLRWRRASAGEQHLRLRRPFHARCRVRPDGVISKTPRT